MLKYGKSRGIQVNKSHAAAYGVLAYMTAWLKYHYPVEYMAAAMNYTDYKKLPKIVDSCRKMDIKLLPPDINESENAFVAKDSAILFGFGNIKGLGNKGLAIIKERDARGAFVSVKDFVTRMTRASAYERKAVESLIKAGAFDKFCDGNRASLLNSIDDFATITKKLQEKAKLLEERTEALNNLQANKGTKTDIGKAERAVANAKKSFDKLREASGLHRFIMTTREDIEEKLDSERELLGFYFSGNPLDAYSQAIKKVARRTDIAALGAEQEKAKVTICGLIKDLEVRQRKKDGQPFCFFTVVDESGEIEAKCFSSKYAILGMSIKENAVMSITGRLSSDNFNQENAEVSYYVNVEDITPLVRDTNNYCIIISGASPADWQENICKIKEYASPVGYAAYWTDLIDLRLRKIDFNISKDILTANIPNLSICVKQE